MIEILLKNGANIEVEGSYKCTPLILGRTLNTYFNFCFIIFVLKHRQEATQKRLKYYWKTEQILKRRTKMVALH
jgi:hypothetical protein